MLLQKTASISISCLHSKSRLTELLTALTKPGGKPYNLLISHPSYLFWSLSITEPLNSCSNKWKEEGEK